MPAFDVIWSGACLGVVAVWSHTRGELISPRLQRVRGLGADPLAEIDYWPCADPSQPVRATRRPPPRDDDDPESV